MIPGAPASSHSLRIGSGSGGYGDRELVIRASIAAHLQRDTGLAMRRRTGSAAAVFAVSFMIALVRRDVAADPSQWQLRVKPGAYSGVAFPGEKAEYQLELENTTKEDREVEVRLRSTSDVGEKWGKDWKLEIAAGKKHTERVTHPSVTIPHERYHLLS